MRKSGLQKQISSIFSDTPVPDTVVSTTMSAACGLMDPDAAPTPATRPSPAHRMAETATGSVQTPAAPAMRPRPLDKPRPTDPAITREVVGRMKKTLNRPGKAPMDPRQKKMAVMVGVLSVVFGVVLFVSLGGWGHSQATAAPGEAAAVETTASAQTLQWHSPQPLPETLRNPMAPAPKTVAAASEETAAATPAAMIVKGIVFSRTNPTAIINDRIVAEGEHLDGTTVVTIGKEGVTFEKNGQRWTQVVQR